MTKLWALYKTVSAEQIRGNFTDIANEVKYKKESYILTRHNKPCLGIVPLELLKILAIIMKDAASNKYLTQILQEHASFISVEDYHFLIELSHNPKPMSASLQSAATSLKGKVKGF